MSTFCWSTYLLFSAGVLKETFCLSWATALPADRATAKDIDAMVIRASLARRFMMFLPLLVQKGRGQRAEAARTAKAI
jgi:hypothetical protein